jgi:hypothetical protein
MEHNLCLHFCLILMGYDKIVEGLEKWFCPLVLPSSTGEHILRKIMGMISGLRFFPDLCTRMFKRAEEYETRDAGKRKTLRAS